MQEICGFDDLHDHHIVLLGQISPAVKKEMFASRLKVVLKVNMNQSSF